MFMNFKDFYNERDFDKRWNLVQRNLPDFLNKKGWKKIGSGAYSTVYSKIGKNYVIKVFEDDHAYQLYLEFIQQNRNNPHVPKIQKIMIDASKQKEINTNEVGIIMMEKLKPVEYSDISWRFLILENFKQYLRNVDAIHTPLDEFLEYFKKRYIQEYGHRKYHFKSIKRFDYFLESNLEICRLLYNLRKFLQQKGENKFFDLHSGNFMIRPSTGEIVVSDPIA